MATGGRGKPLGGGRLVEVDRPYFRRSEAFYGRWNLTALVIVFT